jgi:7-cyano-7-deazaguanine synthase
MVVRDETQRLLQHRQSKPLQAMSKVLVLYSGGLDSTVVLAQALAEGNDVLAVTFDYKQSCSPEIQICQTLASYWGFRHRIVPLELKQTNARERIPARNTLFIAHALEIALHEGFLEIRYGAEPEDVYEDSSEEFVSAMNSVCGIHGVTLSAPLKELPDRMSVLEKALSLGVPLDLVHSSRGPLVNGACKTSRKFMDCLSRKLPCVHPLRFINALSDTHAQTNRNPYDVRTWTKFVGLFAVATSYSWPEWARNTPYKSACQWASNVLMDENGSPELLLEDSKRALDTAANYGIRQALSRLPRQPFLCQPVYAPKAHPVTQQLEQLMYEIDSGDGYDYLIYD